MWNIHQFNWIVSSQSLPIQFLYVWKKRNEIMISFYFWLIKNICLLFVCETWYNLIDHIHLSVMNGYSIIAYNGISMFQILGQRSQELNFTTKLIIKKLFLKWNIRHSSGNIQWQRNTVIQLQFVNNGIWSSVSLFAQYIILTFSYT